MRVRNWRYKAALQRLFSSAPGGHRLNYAFQRLTGGLPLPDAKLHAAVSQAETHLSNLRNHSSVDPSEASLFEFGAGWDLHVPLALAGLGAREQTVIDLRPLVRRSLATDAAVRLAAALEENGLGTRERVACLQGAPTRASLGDSDAGDLGWLRELGIRYGAPRDARTTELPSSSIDLVTSTNTLEHIPAPDIAAILVEARRILRPGGAASFFIDYQDHWSYFDPSIGVYNFLTVEQSGWSRVNPALHYQNRLRHHQYLELFEKAGFCVVSVESTGPDEADLEMLSQLGLASEFTGMTLEQLGVRRAMVCLRPDT